MNITSAIKLDSIDNTQLRFDFIDYAQLRKKLINEEMENFNLLG